MGRASLCNDDDQRLATFLEQIIGSIGHQFPALLHPLLTMARVALAQDDGERWDELMERLDQDLAFIAGNDLFFMSNTQEREIQTLLISASTFDEFHDACQEI